MPADASPGSSAVVNTVLGPVRPGDLGVVATHEALLSVLPGAQYAYDITFDRAEIFASLAAKLHAFKAAGGGTIVDATGMFHGRDLALYEALSRATGVHIVASTGLGPERLLGGYFLTPQTNPPTPWPAEKFAALFTAEVDEGMVIPRFERRAAAGLVCTGADVAGMSATEESLFRASARAARDTGVAASIRFGADALADLDVVLDEGLAPDRIVVHGLDRRDAVDAGSPMAVAERGAYVALDHVGTDDDQTVVDDAERMRIVNELVTAGHADRVLLSSSAVGVAKGHPARDIAYEYVLIEFMPRLQAQGLSASDAQRILVDNPRELLSVRASAAGR